MRQVFNYKMSQFYWKIQQLLQITAILLQNFTVITKCISCKLRQYNMTINDYRQFQKTELEEMVASSVDNKQLRICKYQVQLNFFLISTLIDLNVLFQSLLSFKTFLTKFSKQTLALILCFQCNFFLVVGVRLSKLQLLHFYFNVIFSQ